MINKVHIKNFKSIKDLELDCSRVNIFIGEPNTGKSNILEAIGMLSMTHKMTGINSQNSLKEYIRADDFTDLFYNKVVDQYIEVRIISSLGNDFFSIIYDNSEYLVKCIDEENQKVWIEAHMDKFFRNNQYPKYFSPQVLPIRFYKFKERNDFPSKDIDFLNPPDGDNLLKIIQTRKNIKEFVLDLFSQYKYKYQAIEDINKIYFNLEYKGELISLPFHLLSDTLVRLIFFYSAIELSNEATLLFEEPESHVFPFYNKFLAERIALYSNNQYFIATHNPTFLANIIEQTPDNELKVFITYYEDYQTKIFKLEGERLMDTYKIFGVEMYGNLEKIIKNLDAILKKEAEEHN